MDELFPANKASAKSAHRPRAHAHIPSVDAAFLDLPLLPALLRAAAGEPGWTKGSSVRSSSAGATLPLHVISSSSEGGLSLTLGADSATLAIHGRRAMVGRTLVLPTPV